MVYVQHLSLMETAIEPPNIMQHYGAYVTLIFCNNCNTYSDIK